jgi:hypothetical protein
MANDNIDGLDFPTPDPEDLPEIRENQGEEEESEPSDPSVVAFLDQQQEEWKGKEAAFQRAYGFQHNCRCSEDYAEGKVTEVTECFMRLCNEALDRSAVATYENRMLNIYLNEMLTINNDLAMMLHELGHDEELEKYFNEPADIDDVDATELQDLPELESGEDEEDTNDDDGETALA